MDYLDFKELWEGNNINALDTSVLLDLYFYSSNAIEDIIQNLESIEEQLWIPNQALVEFDRNYKEKKHAAFRKYDTMNVDIDRIIRNFNKSMTTLFKTYKKYEISDLENIKEDINNNINTIQEKIEEYKKDIKVEKNRHKESLLNEKIEKFIEKINALKQVGEGYNILELLEIYEEGEKRYKYKIPPGYLDIKKDIGDNTKTRKYGDLVIWKQLIKKCKSEKKSLLFITNDTKEDWVDKSTKLPLNNLVEEFKLECGKELEFYMIDFITFYKYLSKINIWNNLLTTIELEACNFLEEYLEENKPEFDESISQEINDVLIDEIAKWIEKEYGLEIEEFGEHTIKNIILENIKTDIDGSDIEYSFVVKLTDLTEVWKDSNSFGSLNMEIELECSILGEIIEEDGDYKIVNTTIEIESIDLIDCLEDIDESSICVVCNNAHGEYFYHGEPICETCTWHESKEVCTSCGNVFDIDEMMGSYCRDCFEEMD